MNRAASLLPSISGVGDPTAGTLGWDSVFAVPVSAINPELAKPGVCPSSFQQAFGGKSLQGEFQPWQIVGGGGQQVNFAANVANGTFTGTSGETFELAGCSVQFQVQLQFLPHETQPNTLLLQVQTVGSAVVVTNVLFPDPQPDIVTQAEVLEGFADWFSANIASLNYIFNQVDLNLQLESAYQWMAPTSVSYAFVQGQDASTSYLGVLCMLLNNDPSNLAPQIAAGAIPSGAEAGFLLSPQMMLQQMVLPNMPLTIANSQASQYGMSSDGLSIVNTGDIALQSVEHGGLKYYPELKQLQVSIAGDLMQVSYAVRTEVSPGIAAWRSQTLNYTVGLVAQNNGTQRLGFTAAASSPATTWNEVSEGIKITEDVLALIGVIMLLTAVFEVVMAPGIVAMAVVSVGTAITDMTTQLIESVLAGDVTGKIPSIGPMVMNATKAIQWNGASAFALTSADLSDCLRLGGNPNFTQGNS